MTAEQTLAALAHAVERGWLHATDVAAAGSTDAALARLSADRRGELFALVLRTPMLAAHASPNAADTDPMAHAASATLPAASLAADAPELLRGEGRYVLVPATSAGSSPEIGRGGVGRVLAARDLQLDRDVAIKELLPAFTGSGSRQSGQSPYAMRFLREARLTAQLEHTGVVPVHELGVRQDGTLYYVMRRVRGRPLDQLIAEARTLPERLRLLDHVIRLGQALAYAHSRGVMHRDLKPSNVMIGDFGETALLDWGLAKGRAQTDATPAAGAYASGPAQTADGEALGTPAYMSPEAARGELDRVDERSDVWGLGAVLYELLTGKTPFKSGTVMEVLAEVRRGQIIPVLDRCPTAPPELVDITTRALAPDPAHRYQRAGELVAELESFRDGRLVGAHRYSVSDRVWRWVQRHKAAVAVGAVAIAVWGAGAVTSVIALRKERDQARVQRDQARTFAQLLLDDVADGVGSIPGAAPAVGRVMQASLDYFERQIAVGGTTADVQSAAEGYLRMGLMQEPSDAKTARKNLERARALFRQVPGLDGRRGELHSRLRLAVIGDTDSDINECRAVGKDLAALAAEYPDDVGTLRLLVDTGRALAVSDDNLGHYEDEETDSRAALRTIERLRQRAAPTRRDWVHWGQVQTDLGDALRSQEKYAEATLAYADALADDEQALQLEPAKADARIAVAVDHQRLASSLLEAKKLDELEPHLFLAVHALAEILDRDPLNSHALRAVGDTERVWAHLELARRHPADAQLHWERSVEPFRRALAAQPANLSLLESTATREGEAGHFDRAADLLHAALLRHPDMYDGRLRLVHNLLGAGRFEEAAAEGPQAIAEQKRENSPGGCLLSALAWTFAVDANDRLDAAPAKAALRQALDGPLTSGSLDVYLFDKVRASRSPQIKNALAQIELCHGNCSADAVKAVATSLLR